MDDLYAEHLIEAEKATAKITEWTERRDAAVKAAYDAGKGATPAAIGKAISRSDQAVRDMLRRLGVDVKRSPGRPRKVDGAQQ